MRKTMLALAIGLAVAAAPARCQQVKYVTLAAAQRFPALEAGQIDLLVASSTYTLSRDAARR